MLFPVVTADQGAGGSSTHPGRTGLGWLPEAGRGAAHFALVRQ